MAIWHMRREWAWLCRAAVPVAIFVLCAWILSDKLSMEVLRDLPAQLASIAPWQWVTATLLTAISLYSVGRYDLLAHRHLRTGIADGAAQWSGTIGIAIGQTLGFGLVTGAVARWRMLPGLGFGPALKLSGFVSVSFVLAWMAVTSMVCLLLPAPGWSKWLASAGCAAALCVMAALIWWPQIRVRGWCLRLPSLRLIGGILVWAFVDTAAAAGVLFIMLPAGTLSAAAFYPLFLLALGGALMSNTPGGVGPFEVILLTALPHVDLGALMTAILAYRAIYYALPACLAMLALLRPFRRAAPVEATMAAPDSLRLRGEVGVITQNGGYLAHTGGATLALWPTGQALTGMGDALRGKPKQALEALRAAARDRALIPLLYKCGPAQAHAARRAGWTVLRIADEALVPLCAYALDTPARRNLRRKLRAAAKAGVTVRTTGPLPHADLARIDAAWQHAHGRARGGTMGRYAPDYVAGQWVATAHVGGQCIAFVTVHKGQEDWCLDIMRHTGDAPDGTMHALVHAALEAAKRAGAQHFSLAATPACPNPASALWRAVAMRVVRAVGGPGLRQFKSSFGPEWRPRYAAAPNPVALTIGLGDVARAVHRPMPLTSSNQPHDLDENYELASHRAA
ncbi:phosphatidylglycerol lysyltransferase domain-containing protein [Tateyamaria sp. SN6-1]|uniref:phosphatidylglycerol lysyltransferase domain-containing protein n=1 Tax=Tateyamaria sp. SN6-1 TaxID=3092148 RepID=UPI0039F61060